MKNRVKLPFRNGAAVAMAAFAFVVACSSTREGLSSGSPCMTGADCASGLCMAGLCESPCDPSTGAACAVGCESDNDCATGVCSNGGCFPPSSRDGKKDGDETDTDCGGSAPPCADGLMCLVDADCASIHCTGGTCVVATDTDGRRNGDETDVDCGGTTTRAPPCAGGKGCKVAKDCISMTCKDHVCGAANASDGVRDGDETDVDCGGSSAPPCAPSKDCLLARDCTSQVCTGGTCAAPTATDGVQNGDETDVDCGGTSTHAPGCGIGKKCVAHGDCASDGCSYKHVCIPSRSCAAHHGGDTCGAGDDGDTRPQCTGNMVNGVDCADPVMHEDCCDTVEIPNGNFRLNRFLITAGRIRAFVERFNGNLRSFTKTIPDDNPWWSHDWDKYIPSTLTEVNQQLGPYPAPLTSPPNAPPPADQPPILGDGTVNPNGQQGQWRFGCTLRDTPPPADKSEYGARTWWTPANQAPGGDGAVSFTQDVLDEKIINCIDSYMMTAFCIWDGGHLATGNEINKAWTQAGGDFPWGPSPVAIDDMNNPVGPAANYVVHEFGKEFQGPYSYTWPLVYNRQTAHIAAPGRKPLGSTPGTRVADLAGLAYELTAIDMTTNMVGHNVNGSWESHVILPGGVFSPDVWYAWFAYWAASGRCAFSD
jgi:hypothetical protein